MSGNHTPWSISGRNGYGELNGTTVSDSRGYVVAVTIADIPELKSLECAEFVLTAVNSYASSQAEIERLRTALSDIAAATDPDDPESYRSDDREGCLDTVHAFARAALGSKE